MLTNKDIITAFLVTSTTCIYWKSALTEIDQKIVQFSVQKVLIKRMHTEEKWTQMFLYVYVYSMGILELFDFNVGKYCTYNTRH
jgi:hypothetical protein